MEGFLLLSTAVAGVEDGRPLLGVVELLLVCFDCFGGTFGFF